MPFTTLDWAIIAASIVISFLPAIFFAKRAGTNTTEFFTSGRAAPWWLVGISMVATTFSTDTPNLVTNLVREHGVAENWVWWSFLLTGMMTVFFYARLWRRSGVLTDLEFYEIRYSGKAATFLRGFRAVYLGLFFNCVIMATVNLAATKIGNIVLGWPMERTLVVCAVMTIFFASVSGLWGVLVTDSLQFMLTMSGTFAVAYFALKQPAVGGLAGLFAKVDPASLALSVREVKPVTLSCSAGLPPQPQIQSGLYAIVGSKQTGPTTTEFQKRAGITSTPMFERIAMSSMDVARAGYVGMMRGKRIVIPGLQNKIMAQLVRFGPRKMIADAVKKMNTTRADGGS